MRQSDEGRQLSGGGFVIAIFRRIPERMSGAATGREFDRFAERNGFFWHHGGSRGANDERRAAVHFWPYGDRGRRGRRRRDIRQTIAERTRTVMYLADAKRRDLAVRDQHGSPYPVADDRGDDPPIGENIVVALAENPMRTADLGFDRRQGFDRGAAQK
jgi:hypothetical protein